MFRLALDPARVLAAMERQTQGLLTSNGAMIFKASQPDAAPGTYPWGPSVISVRS
jgi:hypothetical protein